MKVLIIFFVALIISCNPTKDEDVSPASLKQQRMIINYKGQTELGIHGGVDLKEKIKIRTINSGDYSIRGQGECGFYFGESFSKKKYVEIDTSKLPDKEVCILSLNLRINELDAPSIGLFVLRKFKNSLVQPLEFQVNGVKRKGVNWVQLKKPTLNKIKSSKIKSGIEEGQDIELYPWGDSGYINIMGCGYKRIIDFKFKENEKRVWKTNLISLYKGKIDQSCVFDILINNRNFQYKQGGTLLVHTYEGQGSFLDAPRTYLKKKHRCFAFEDPYVIGISVNGFDSKLNVTNLCAFKKDQYEVIATTSKQRIFYGIYDEKSQDWTTIK